MRKGRAIPDTVIFISLAILAVLALATAACLSPQSPVSATTAAPALTTVRVAYQPTTSFGPIYIARDEGYFARQGIDIELVRINAFTMALPLLVNGDVAVASGPLTSSIINAMDKGAHIRIVADKGNVAPGYCTGVAILVRKDLYESGRVRTMSDLKGRKFFWTMGSGDNSYTLLRALALGNLTMEDIEAVPMDYPSGVVAIKNGAVDAGLFTEPYTTEAVSSGTAVVLSPAQEFIPGYSIPLFYGPAILDRDPELGRRFMVAYLEGVKQYNEGKTGRNLAIMENYTGLDRDMLNRSCWYPVTGNGSAPRKLNRDTMEWMYSNRTIGRIPQDAELYDTSFADYANGIIRNASGRT